MWCNKFQKLKFWWRAIWNKFKSWNIEKFDLICDLRINFLFRIVLLDTIFLSRNHEKNYFFLFHKITQLHKQKCQKLQMLTKTSLSIHANACKSICLLHSWTKSNSQSWARIMKNIRLFINLKIKIKSLILRRE